MGGWFCRPIESPFCTILRYPFLVTDPKKFLKAPIFTNFEERAPKKRNSLVKNFQKGTKNAFLACFSKTCLRRKKFDQNGVFIVVWESSENLFCRPKNKVNKICEFFLKILDPPHVLDRYFVERSSSNRVKILSLMEHDPHFFY